MDANSYPSPLCPLYNTHTHDTYYLFNCTHIRTTLSLLDFVDIPRPSDCSAGQMDGEAGWWTTSGNIGLPLLARIMREGRQQQQKDFGHEKNVCFSLFCIQVTHSTALSLLFHEAHHNYIQAMYPCDYNDVCMMSAVLMQLLYGDYQPKKTKNILLR